MFKQALGLALAVTALAASGAQFASAASPRGDTLRLTCPGTEVVQADCSLAGIGKDGKQALPAIALKFTEPTLQALLLQKVASAKRDNPTVGDIAMDAQAVATLQSIDWERCFESRQMGSDAVMCAPPGLQPSSAVLFLRGKCERCTFEPIVLRKE